LEILIRNSLFFRMPEDLVSATERDNLRLASAQSGSIPLSLSDSERKLIIMKYSDSRDSQTFCQSERKSVRVILRHILEWIESY
jgi:hypothetical protein